MSRVCKLIYSGPKGEWLDGNAKGPKDESELDFGHKDGNFLVFSLKLTQPDGQSVKTFLVGKMNEHEIVGTFVGNVGITGEWTAVRVSNRPKSR